MQLAERVLGVPGAGCAGLGLIDGANTKTARDYRWL
jgi:hypothetical protein